ncbi:MAG: FAD-binding protein [Ruminococcaceae bacterium]|nr:FAD-binding protein [Oscillospiraceae bacterium]
MIKQSIEIKGRQVPCYTMNTLVIGSGCAGFNAADWLHTLGVTDIAMVTEGVNLGTSRNTGSDKQTYYKLSLSSSEEDSVADMAKSLFAGKGVNGEHALIEAACSAKSFIKLANLGVPFPTNLYGEFVGYMTDHDIHKRASSAGPLTSKFMTEALERSVNTKGIDIIDDTTVVKLIVKEGKVIGAVGIDKNTIYEENNGVVLFVCQNIIMATGGPAGIYENSVFPKCHVGMSSLAIEAGAETANFQEWQYGLASVDFRWNVSGTYQQVIPKYISVDENGNEREFLNDYFENPADALSLVFMKGYQWPFDTAKAKGSSLIDLIIFNETVNKGNKVYMDFRSEPTALKDGFECLSEEAYSYLKNSDALIELPIKRLEKMNKKAIDLYMSNGIDLYKEPLRVAVCAQHNNGGINVDLNWETNIKGLYVAGEAAGTFGVYRPGGSALNSTQVGSMRAAESIALGNRKDSKIYSVLEDVISGSEDVLDFVFAAGKGEKYEDKYTVLRDTYRTKMSAAASYIRIPDRMRELKDDVWNKYKTILADGRGTDVCNVMQLLRLKDMFLTQACVLSAMIEAAETIGTRGGALVSDKPLTGESIFNIEIGDKSAFDGKRIIAVADAEGITTSMIDVTPIPQPDLWFENVWNDYMERWSLK